MGNQPGVSRENGRADFCSSMHLAPIARCNCSRLTGRWRKTPLSQLNARSHLSKLAIRATERKANYRASTKPQ